MSLPMNVLQSIISKTRNEINCLHKEAETCVRLRDERWEDNEAVFAKKWHYRFIAARRSVVKLAAIQKALKEEMQTQISLQRVFKHPAKAVYE